MIGAPVEDDGPSVLAGHIRSVAACRDKAAFAALFRYYAPRVKGYLIRQGCAAALAEDLAQEAMVTVWRKADLYDPAKAEPSTWVFTIVRNLRVDALRRERLPQADLDGVPEQADDTPAADEMIASGQRAALVRQAIASLPPDQAEVVRRAFFEDKVHTTIADELGVPLGTVKSRMRLAMEKIRSATRDPETEEARA